MFLLLFLRNSLKINDLEREKQRKQYFLNFQ
nr:MAG TPA: hypothetical protein [Caudoviricetes sp.]